MRVVTIAPFRISPPDNGGRSFIAGAGRHYATRCEGYACLAVTTLRDRGPAPATSFQYREFPSPASLLQVFDRLRLFPKLPYYRAMRWHAPALAQAAMAFAPDIVEVHLPWLVGIRRHLPCSVKVVLIMQNVETLWQEDLIVKRRFPGFFRGLLQEMEREAVMLADHVLCLTPQDRDAVIGAHGLAQGAVSVIPPGIDLTPSPVPEMRREGPGRVIFVGSAFSANEAAARCLVERVAPALDGGTEVLVAGGVCDRLRALPMPPNVRLCGRVADLHGLLCTCDALVNPSCLRTGIHIKVIEALAAGCRVISTPDGARGYEDLVGGLIRIGDIASFGPLIRAATRLTTDERELIREYEWGQVVQRRLRLYRALAEKAGEG